MEPGWFNSSGRFIVAPDGEIDEEAMLDLHADPEGQYPDPVPYGERVQITGRYNHPAADACTLSWYSPDSYPTIACRTEFAVTHIERVTP